METIKLSNLEGISRKSGTDEHGNQWIEFEVDAFSGDCECETPECDPDTCPRLATDCSECGARITAGWVCLDGGEEVCDEHVTYEDNEEKVQS